MFLSWVDIQITEAKMWSSLLGSYSEAYDHDHLDEVLRLYDNPRLLFHDVHQQVQGNAEEFPNEEEASTRVTQEANFTSSQVADALLEVEDLNTKDFIHHDRGFHLLETNLRELQGKLVKLKQWHQDKHRKSVEQGELKALLLAE